jgi:hypothetical protein
VGKGVLGPQSGGENHFWVRAMQSLDPNQTTPAQGMGGLFGQYQPFVDSTDTGSGSAAFSLAQLSASNITTGALELGWIVAPSTYNDFNPHLFVFTRYKESNGYLHTCLIIKDQGAWKCLDENNQKTPTDFVATKTDPSYLPGATVEVNTLKSYAVEHKQGNWWIWYKDDYIGFFPDSHWNTTFTQITDMVWQGEVVSYHSPPCEDMGNGIRGSEYGSAVIDDMKYIIYDGQTPISATAHLDTDNLSSYYDAGHFAYYPPDQQNTFRGFTYGGPKTCSIAVK